MARSAGTARRTESGKAGTTSVFALEGEAQALADRLPDLLLEALRVANTVAHGIHGRRRRRHRRDLLAVPAVPGERPGHRHRLAALGQLRHISTCASANGRRRTPSGSGRTSRPPWSSAAIWRPITKRDRAVVLTLAIAELLVRAGERIALLGADAADGQPQGHARIAETLAAHEGDAALQASLPPPARLSPVLQRAAVRRFPRSAGRHRPAHQRDGRGRRQRPSDADPRSRRGDAGLRGPHGVPLAGRRRALDRRSRRDAAAGVPEEARRASRRASRRPRAASAGRSWCITPTGRPPSRCWR